MLLGHHKNKIKGILHQCLELKEHLRNLELNQNFICDSRIHLISIKAQYTLRLQGGKKCQCTALAEHAYCIMNPKNVQESVNKKQLDMNIII